MSQIYLFIYILEDVVKEALVTSLVDVMWWFFEVNTLTISAFSLFTRS